MLNRRLPNLNLLLITTFLVGIGLIMVNSVIQPRMEGKTFFLKQLFGVILGYAGMYLAYKIDLYFLRRITRYLLMFSVILLILVLIIGVEVKGSKRFLSLGPLLFQPSEFMKLTLVLFWANLLYQYKILKRKNEFGRIILTIWMFIISCISFYLIEKEPDLGTVLVLGGSMVGMLFLGGIKKRYVVSVMLIGVLVVVALVFLRASPATDYRKGRIAAWRNPWMYASREGYQTVEAILALGSGKIKGIGLDESRQKLFYLPEAHTDMIFAIIGEEFGFLGCLIVLSSFIYFTYCGFSIASKCYDFYSMLLAAGLTGIISLQALLNIGVAIGALPVTGVTLPFISYGNTSLVVSLTNVGILLNISRRFAISTEEGVLEI